MPFKRSVLGVPLHRYQEMRASPFLFFPVFLFVFPPIFLIVFRAQLRILRSEAQGVPPDIRFSGLSGNMFKSMISISSVRKT